jgi:hypothetical protein
MAPPRVAMRGSIKSRRPTRGVWVAPCSRVNAAGMEPKRMQ